MAFLQREKNIPILGARFDLCTQKITSTKMSESKVFHNVGTLCAFSTSRATYV